MEQRQISIENNKQAGLNLDNTGSYVVAIEKKKIARDRIHRDHTLYLLSKRVTDVLLSAIAMVVLTPINILVMFLIWIDDPSSSPFYISVRCGKDGKEFRLFKFRTMEKNADQKIDALLSQNEMDGPVFKIKEDPRITRVGRILRKTSIDEIPQFVNILKGDMSLVGPRPALPREVEQYDEYARQRLNVVPGLTCLWQIQPNRNQLSFDEWVALDIEYMKKRSFIMDFAIMFRTVKAVVQMHGE